MTAPHFRSDEERKAFWAGWLKINVWDELKAEGIDKPTLEQYFAKSEQLSQIYIQEWEASHGKTNDNDDDDNNSATIQSAELEAPEIEEGSATQPTVPAGSPAGQASATGYSTSCATYLKLSFVILNLILAIVLGGNIFVVSLCMLPTYALIGYEKDKADKASAIHDNPSFYNYGTISCQ